MSAKRKEKGARRSIGLWAGVILFNLIACIVVLEAFSYFALDRKYPPLWLRGYRAQYPVEARYAPLGGVRRGDFRLKSSAASLRMITPEPKYLNIVPASVLDRSQSWPSGLWVAAPQYLKANVRGRSIIKTTNGKIVRDVGVETDQYGRRLTFNANPKQRTRHLVAFGCSYTFGEGVEYEQTFPSRIAELAPGYHVYNYGRPGDGPVEALVRAQSGDFGSQIQEKGGIGIYLLIADHIHRLNALTYYHGLRLSNPYFTEDEAGNLVRYERFDSFASRAQNLMLDILSNSWTAAYFDLDYPYFYGEKDIEFLARLLKELSEEYKRKTGGSDFVVVFYPEPWAPRFHHVMRDYLDAYHIHYLDYGDIDLPKFIKGFTNLAPYDGHPSPAAYEFLARLVVTDLGLKQK